jgi:hypothetical protein
VITLKNFFAFFADLCGFAWNNLFLHIAHFLEICFKPTAMHVCISSKWIRPVLLIFMLSISHAAFCWGLTGHRVIAQIAQQHLTAKSKKEIQKLIGKESLVWWSNWADFIRSDSNWNHASPWHYVDVPGHISKEVFLAAVRKLPGKTLYTQIPAMIAQLRNKSLPAEQRRTALYFLVHLVADLHQPLHVGRHEDAGGNRIVVYWFGEKTNLHTVWDSEFVNFQQYSYSEYAQQLDIASAGQVKSWQSSSLDDWFYESHVLSDSIYDATPNEAKLSYQYNYKFQGMLNQQLLKGGIRLAALLNRAFE